MSGIRAGGAVRRCRDLVLAALLVLGAGTAAAQQEAARDTVVADDATQVGGALMSVTNQAAQMQDGTQVQTYSQAGLFTKFTVTPKAGVKANVRQNTFYGEVMTNVGLMRGGNFVNNLKWNYEEYRKQDKNVERRNVNFNYGFGQQLPLVVRIDGDWSWSHDKTVNTAGFSNLFAQDNKSLRLAASKTKHRLGGLIHSFRVGTSFDDRVSENQNTPNNAREGSLDGGLQTGWEIADGVVLAGRVYGRTVSGQKTLGFEEGPSSTQGDTLGVGVYFDRRFTKGSVAVTRANFERRFLDFRKNSQGLIDTVGIAEDLKVVQELETKDATSLEFENQLRVVGIDFRTLASRTTDDLDYAANGQGLKQRHLDNFEVGAGSKVGVDSLAVIYTYGWTWDDQRIQGATANRGRQYNKAREFEFVWVRPLFAGTELKLRTYEGLFQDIAEAEHNQNDKDRYQNDFSVELGRRWPDRFTTNLLYSFRSSEDRSIRETRSSNNNIKTSYEIAPDYTWYVSDWLTFGQVYKVYIQYTDYVYSELESVNRDDNYNKRGNLSTKVTLNPTSRLQVEIRHDYNKKFNATATGTSTTGGTFYRRDLNQTISKLDLGLSYRVVPGVILEAATYRTRDDQVRFTTNSTNETTDYSGEIWVGTRVDRQVGDMQISAIIKKYNAFGPAVTESSADYWEADAYVKWEF
ncbi:hypothetical protein KDM41_16315 [bacterium]|nr:hypothetical protein [bacterium]